MGNETAEVGFKPECEGRSCGFGCKGRITDRMVMQLDGEILSEDLTCLYTRNWAGRLSFEKVQGVVWGMMENACG